MKRITGLIILLAAAMLFTASQAFAATSSGQNMAPGYYGSSQKIGAMENNHITPYTVCGVNYGPAKAYPYNTSPADPKLSYGTLGYSYPYNGEWTSTCHSASTVPYYPGAKAPGVAGWEPK
jgi:hypothetical protein